MESLLKLLTGYFASGVEGIAGIIIAFAALQAALQAALVFAGKGRWAGDAQEPQIEAVRLKLGRWLALALEFELGADILRTAIAPTWSEIGQLAAIAAIRTLLNYFLQQEIDRAASRQVATSPPTPAPVTGAASDLLSKGEIKHVPLFISSVFNVSVWSAIIEFLGALLILAYMCFALLTLFRTKDISQARIVVTDGIIAGLSFKLAGTLLRTIELQSWPQILTFLAIFVIRTVLKRFFSWEQHRLQLRRNQTQTVGR
ncbi:hypothetical protein KDW_47710 [Dictyobacter vulcani]|uniref:DUF1622 domain-containing protein n=1 Tax=Dictyobacter vulcani TaxID=2607529 RepID=A0A5J4KWV2_9CHLR|nr:DUF1622 domain-containing protein [Dictyobacter vulcani]GER90609.1 hypothetical protein KDW_47710 [Dictyobacter vulcani]